MSWREPVVAPPPDQNILVVADAIERKEPIAPLPAVRSGLDPARVALGKRLFNDTALSENNTISCASCHPLDRAGTDNRRRSIGVGGTLGTINAPTVFNAALNFAQFWDGRAANLAEQVGGPIRNPLEMATTWPDVVARLSRSKDYRAAFAETYPEGITADTISDAIATFEETLLTPDAPFDRYLRGDTGALSAEQIAGYERFKTLGCASCHQGANVGGNLYQRFGVMGDYFANRKDVTTSDLGRFNVTGQAEDRHVFKVPSLRNVALTAPYFHDGSTKELGEAVDIMARYQLGRELSAEDRKLLVAFLTSLTGTYLGVPLK